MTALTPGFMRYDRVLSMQNAFWCCGEGIGVIPFV